MIEDLLAASSLLSTALKRYLAASSVIASYCNAGHGLGSLPRESLDALLDEIELSSIYNTQFQQARLHMTQTKNTIPTLTPIAILPSDILAHVFEEVVAVQPGYFKYTETAEPFRVRYPETLTHVCSRWRRVALGLRPLWSRIDLHFDQESREPGPLVRAQLFSSRANPLPLDLHLFGPSYVDHERWYSDSERDDFLMAIAPRVKSLHLSSFNSFGSHHSSALTALFGNCMPGMLNEVSINLLPENDGAVVIGSTESRDNYYDEEIDVPHDDLDMCLLPVRVLRLSGVFFHWTSHAYYGLVTLHLQSTYQCPTITEPQLFGILAACPGLCSLHLAYKPVTPLLNPAHHQTVYLSELENLSMGFMNVTARRVVLLLISPGPNLQKLRLWMDSEDFQAVEHEIGAFFARTSVKKLNIWLEGGKGHIASEAFRLFRRLSGLKQLVLCHARLTANKTGQGSVSGNDLPSTHARIDELRLDDCVFELDQLAKARELFPFQVLKLWNCSVQWENRERFCPAREVAHGIATIFPTAEFIEGNDQDTDTLGVWD